MRELTQLEVLLAASETTCPECGPVSDMVYLCPHATENADALRDLAPLLARAVLAAGVWDAACGVYAEAIDSEEDDEGWTERTHQAHVAVYEAEQALEAALDAVSEAPEGARGG